MGQNKKEKTKDKNPIDKEDFKEVVKIMANTPPISNEEIVKRNKKRQK